jgi:ribosomal protein S18 acetylase RimI-like enzyme
MSIAMTRRANKRVLPLKLAETTRGGVTLSDADASDLTELIALDEKIAGYSRADFWRELFQQKGAGSILFVLVARKSGVLVGYVLGEIRSWPVRTPVCGWLYAIGVEKNHRLQKIASALMTELVSRFRQNGVEAIRTVIGIDDHLLMSFLRSFGMSAGPFVELEMVVSKS